MNDIKLACNWSRPLKKLLDEKSVHIDYIKTGVYGSFYDDIDMMLALRPVLIHGLGYKGHTGMKTLHEVDFDRANALLEKCGSPHYGLHFGIENKNVSGMTDGEIYDFMFKQTQIFKERLKVPLLLENMPDSIKHRTVFDVYSSFDHRYFNKFIFDNDVFFLLDLMHAKISAVFNGWDVKQYLESLPLKRIREIHVNGSGFDEKGNVEDTHQSMEPEDYTLLEWVLARTNPDIVTLEYSGVKGESVDKVRENLIVQLDRLSAAIKSA